MIEVMLALLLSCMRSMRSRSIELKHEFDPTLHRTPYPAEHAEDQLYKLEFVVCTWGGCDAAAARRTSCVMLLVMARIRVLNSSLTYMC